MEEEKYDSLNLHGQWTDPFNRASGDLDDEDLSPRIVYSWQYWGPSTLNLIQIIIWVQRFCWRKSIEIKVWLSYQKIRRSHIDIDVEFGFANIRGESKDLTFSQVKDLECKERESLILNIESSNLSNKFEETFKLRDENMTEYKMDWPQNSGVDIFSAVWSSSWFDKPRRTWYTPEYLNNLKDLLHRFPSSPHKIAKLLRIPKSTFARLRREIVTKNGLERRKLNWQSSHPELSREEQILITQIVQPPTEPLTLDRISSMSFWNARLSTKYESNTRFCKDKTSVLI